MQTPEEYIEMQSEIHRRHAERVKEALAELLPKLQPPKETPEEKRERLRDLFASQALAGMLAYYNRETGDFHSNSSFQKNAEYAYEQADAMLSARDKSYAAKESP